MKLCLFSKNQEELNVCVLQTHVHLYRGTFHGRETDDPGLFQSHRPSSAELAASPEPGTETGNNH